MLIEFGIEIQFGSYLDSLGPELTAYEYNKDVTLDADVNWFGLLEFRDGHSA